jgi:hypothetical protein
MRMMAVMASLGMALAPLAKPANAAEGTAAAAADEKPGAAQ